MLPARFTYAWDADGHMTVATAKDNTVQVKNQYDGQGRRVRKDVFHWDPTANNGQGGWALSFTRKFDYAGGQLVAELDGNGSLVTTYAWAGGTLVGVSQSLLVGSALLALGTACPPVGIGMLIAGTLAC